ncbi:MAG: cell wall metabolism sensor histidine kinase WalK [Ruminococcaceae bacterium]|nr:cell wall metabolism sensor histidine kinase WalK [Oscillospiraceae bacterium]
MYRSIYFKIVLIFVVFMITVMAVVGIVLINSVYSFYSNEFSSQIEEYFGGEEDLTEELKGVMTSDGFWNTQKQILAAHADSFGIDLYRNFYILDKNCNVLEGSGENSDAGLKTTPNLLSAMNGELGDKQVFGSEYSDYALFLENGEYSCIIYILDTQDEMRELTWQLFSIILQSVFFGLIISVILSFFLAKAITSPIQKITRGAQLVASGEFSEQMDVSSKDEIGVLMSTFNDMQSALKNTLDEVSGERQKLETVFLYLKDSVIAFSDKGNVIHINQSAKILLGDMYNEDFNFKSFLSMLSIGQAEDFMKKAIKEQSFVLRDVKFGSKALDVNLGNFKYIEGKKTHDGCIVVMHDITNRYELEKARSEFVANVSHELRTPLTVIKGAIDTVMTYGDMDSETRESFLGSALDESNRMLRIVRDLLILTRLDNKKTQWKISRYDMNKTLSHLCEVMGDMAKDRGHRLSLNVIDGPLPEMTGDKERIEQVLINIMTNAIKYTPDNGKIEVEARSVQKNVVIKVTDNGIGISEEDLPRLFERFYRADKSRTNDPTVATETGGTGLGLAIAKEMVEAHGGEIIMESERGVGTSVTITLPVESKLENSD